MLRTTQQIATWAGFVVNVTAIPFVAVMMLTRAVPVWDISLSAALNSVAACSLLAIQRITDARVLTDEARATAILHDAAIREFMLAQLKAGNTQGYQWDMPKDHM